MFSSQTWRFELINVVVLFCFVIWMHADRLTELVRIAYTLHSTLLFPYLCFVFPGYMLSGWIHLSNSRVQAKHCIKNISCNTIHYRLTQKCSVTTTWNHNPYYPPFPRTITPWGRVVPYSVVADVYQELALFGQASSELLLEMPEITDRQDPIGHFSEREGSVPCSLTAVDYWQKTDVFTIQ